MKCLVGIDDTDSSKGFCTTYLAFKVASQSSHANFRVFGYPRLVRLNPNVPFKTRGNAAVCLPLETEEVKETFESVCSIVERLSDAGNGANPGVVLLHDPRTAPYLSERMGCLPSSLGTAWVWWAPRRALPSTSRMTTLTN
ncbi:MAG: hypothetical protein E6K89_00970 [Thaumarchaeota archaeon]|nr:MAG: hypothetical protein E6K89_00970 [Nitrososphaerota archaeon]